ncbi:hypothetical protein [Acidovorax sp. NCPPB 4044]|uniref:hypothetical protein n=1 Tax=Acidovorax sp. NCPPB 4044 TaxID=2940490 RepID=UPI0023025AE1|nr:hypothetical protein [Acidovorax sp. NCPPB 4044]MDA8523297.1 hypothetical protein [Acidovorax sp. NCPPB 4044]
MACPRRIGRRGQAFLFLPQTERLWSDQSLGTPSFMQGMTESHVTFSRITISSLPDAMRKTICIFLGSACGVVLAVSLFAAYGFLFASPHGRGEEHAIFWTKVLFLGVIPSGAVLGAIVVGQWGKFSQSACKNNLSV